MPTQPLWNLGPPAVDTYGMISGIGQAFEGAFNRSRRRGQEDEQLALEKAKLARELALDEQTGKDLTNVANLLGGSGVATGVPGSPAERLLNVASAGGSGLNLPTFAKIEGATPSADIRGVIANASAVNEIDPRFMERMAAVESRFNPNAQHPGSKASGLFQFIPSTWAQYGGNGSPFDPSANAMAAGRLTADNRNVLRSKLGRDPTYGELYLAHQQGAGGALGLLTNPDAPAASIVGAKAVSANLPKGVDPRSVTAGQFASIWTRRFADLDARGGQTAAQPAPGVPAPVRRDVAPVMAEQQPAAPLPPMAVGRAAMADVPAANATDAAYFVPPASSPVSGVTGGAMVGPPAAAPVPPTVAAPAAAPPQQEAFVSQGLRSAQASGMPPQQVAIVAAMARNPRLQQYAGQILAKYAAPERRSELQFQKGADGSIYALDPDTGRAERAVGATQQRETYRPMTPDERRAYGLGDDAAGVIGPDGKPSIVPGAPKTNVNVDAGQKGDTEYDKTVGKANAETFIDLQKQGRNASAVKNSLNLMETMTKNPNFYSGIGQEYVQGAKKALAAIGVNAEGNKPNEVFDALSKQMTADALGGKLGAGVSNTDVAFLQSAGPTLGATPEGNRALINMRRKVEDRKQVVAQMAREYAARPENKGRIDAGFEAEVAAFAEANPVFAQEIETIQPDPNARYSGAPTTEPQRGPVQIRGDAEFNALPSGAIFIGPDGKRRRKP